MKKIILILIVILVSCQRKPEIPVSQNFNIVKLADGVYACINKMGGKAICNAGIINIGDGTVIFDTFLSPDAASEISELVKKLNLPPIKYVVNSHWHNDHIRGNQVFSKGVDIISTKKTAELIKINEPQEIAAEKSYAPKQLAYWDSLRNNFKGDHKDREYQTILMWQAYYTVLVESNEILKTRIPNVFVDKEKIIKGTKRNVKLMCYGKGHTESDLILYLPEEKIVFTGDLVFIKMHPYLADGYIEDWKNYLTAIEDLGIVKLVPGHGNIGDARDLGFMKEYLKMIEKQTQKMIDEGLSITATDSIDVPEPFSDWWFDNFFAMNLRFMYKKMNSIK